MSGQKNFRQSDWLIELPPRKNVEARKIGIRSTFRGSTFSRLVEIYELAKKRVRMERIPQMC